MLSSSDGEKHHRKGGSKSKETNAAYELYKKQKREKMLERERRAQAKLEGIDVAAKPRKISLDDFPNWKRKIVVQNIPLSQSTQEIMAYFYSILSQVSKEHYNKNPLMSVRRYEELAFVTLEFRRRADAEICLNLDGTDFSNSCPVPMRIMRVRRFVD